MTLKNIPHPPGYEGLMEKLVAELGIELDGASGNCLLTDRAVETLMKRCALCEAPKACERYLTDMHGHITAAPHYCANRKMITFLQENLPRSGG
ncbi:MAG: DUF6455 family protein [Paracoccaceae bacterium]|nr:DUF6455 family protein [Paracoccaceae bacterium]